MTLEDSLHEPQVRRSRDFHSVVQSGIFLPHSDNAGLDEQHSKLSMLHEARDKELRAIRADDENDYVSVRKATDRLDLLMAAALGRASFPLIAEHGDNAFAVVNDVLHVRYPEGSLGEADLLGMERRVQRWADYLFASQQNVAFRDVALLKNLSAALAGIYFMSVRDSVDRWAFDVEPYLSLSAHTVGKALAADTLLRRGRVEASLTHDRLVASIVLPYIEKTSSSVPHGDWWARGARRLVNNISNLTPDLGEGGLVASTMGVLPSDLALYHAEPNTPVSARTTDFLLHHMAQGTVEDTLDVYRELVHSAVNSPSSPGSRRRNRVFRAIMKRLIGAELPFVLRNGTPGFIEAVPRTDGLFVEVGRFPYSSVDDAFDAMDEDIADTLDLYASGDEWEFPSNLSYVSAGLHALYNASIPSKHLSDEEFIIENTARHEIADLLAADLLIQRRSEVDESVKREFLRTYADCNVDVFGGELHDWGVEGWRVHDLTESLRSRMSTLLALREEGIRGRGLLRHVLGRPPGEIEQTWLDDVDESPYS